MSIKEKLYEEIELEINSLEDLEYGSDNNKAAVDGLTKLVDRVIELEKIEDERAIKSKEEEAKAHQVKDEKKDRLIKNGISVAGIVIPSVITIWGTLKSLEFEKTGSVTTIMGRGFINKLLPKK